ncbi:MAG: hypothetical protein IPK72_09265 [Candidatus Eisenbacteria bacterium]|nr:hypothetical protein [Candidatus Eisenbacteria bacterium]
MREHWYEQASEEERLAAECVVDWNAPEMRCPACLHQFATGPRECPNCGLFLG